MTVVEAGDVTPVLRWVRPADETAIRDAFALATKAADESVEAGREWATLMSTTSTSSSECTMC